MAVIARWKSGFEHFFKADAQEVANEISDIGDNVTPYQILDKARDETTELHKCFEWDDAVAAEKFRLETARKVVQFLVIEKSTDNPNMDNKDIRLFYKTKNEIDEGYKPVTIIIKREDEYLALLERARNELLAFQKKYGIIAELEPIFEAIKQVV